MHERKKVMNANGDVSNERCQVCREVVPPGRLPLVCSGCRCALHPSCATVVERGPGWGNREMFCASCAEARTGGDASRAVP